MSQVIQNNFPLNSGYVTPKGTLVKITGYDSDDRSILVKRLDTGEENLPLKENQLHQLKPVSELTSQELKKVALQPLRLATGKNNAEFQDDQWEAIEGLVRGRSRQLVVQRTGWGKSMVYFLSTLLLRLQGRGCTLLISPLLALMRNQIESADKIGVKADAINTATQNDWDNIQKRLLDNQVDVLLISPERLANEDFLTNVLRHISNNVGLFVVDEAHCISDWGHDFRPDYQRIVRILQALPQNIPILATTATANNRVIDDIKTQLGQNLRISRGMLARDSLNLQNIWLPNQAARLAWLSENINKFTGNGIIYTLTIKDAEVVADWLRAEGINAVAYHGKLNTDTRQQLEEQLLNNELTALVATNALGMGFDKPDLGFVVHYQRPSSIVHYYQQVGRAGRGISKAYGILLSGQEDQKITDYFIEAAFPPEDHTAIVLSTLKNSINGLSKSDLEREINLSKGQIDKVIKLLSILSPSPIVKQEHRWKATAIGYQPDKAKIERLTKIRTTEQEQMLKYMQSDRDCLMMFLAKELDDPHASPCGRCAVCIGEPLFPETYSQSTANRAVQFLRRSEQIIEPRKQIPYRSMPIYKFTGNLPRDLQAEQGRALAIWGDAGWGELVKSGKYQNNHFDDALVDATLNMIQRWKPKPFPTWVTCVPSLNHPTLVPDFARRLAAKLGLPFIDCISKTHSRHPQKQMSNSYQQAHNLDGAFVIDQSLIKHDALFLVDDMVDSRWTFTITAALLKRLGCGAVFPVALSVTSLSAEN